jgi:hypothetical protein
MAGNRRGGQLRELKEDILSYLRRRGIASPEVDVSAAAESVDLETATIRYLETCWDYDLRAKNEHLSLAGKLKGGNQAKLSRPGRNLTWRRIDDMNRDGALLLSPAGR